MQLPPFNNMGLSRADTIYNALPQATWHSDGCGPHPLATSRAEDESKKPAVPGGLTLDQTDKQHPFPALGFSPQTNLVTAANP